MKFGIGMYSTQKPPDSTRTHRELYENMLRHARLAGYHMHEGNNARAWVTVQTAGDLPKMMAKDIFFITGFAGAASGLGSETAHTWASRSFASSPSVLSWRFTQ